MNATDIPGEFDIQVTNGEAKISLESILDRKDELMEAGEEYDDAIMQAFEEAIETLESAEQ